MRFRGVSRCEGQGRDPPPATADSTWTRATSLPAQCGREPGAGDGPRTGERASVCPRRDERGSVAVSEKEHLGCVERWGRGQPCLLTLGVRIGTRTGASPPSPATCRPGPWTGLLTLQNTHTHTGLLGPAPPPPSLLSLPALVPSIAADWGNTTHFPPPPRSPQIHSIPALPFQGIPLASQFHPEV